MPQYAARRVLAASVDEVWAVLADPDRFKDWWPGVERVEPSVRRAFAPGAHWRIEGPTRSNLFRRPGLSGSLLILEVVTERRLAFQLAGEGVDVELDLEPAEGDDETIALLAVQAPRFGGVRRTVASEALGKLAALVRPPAA